MKIFGIYFLILIGFCSACQVPVFRYALERWRPDAYHLKISYSKLDSDLEQKLIDLSSEAQGVNASLNLNLHLNQSDTITDAKYELFPPATGNSKELLSSGSLTEESLDEITKSPKRDEIVSRLLSGDSAVWVIIKSGDDVKDEAFKKALFQALELASKQIKLPEGIIGEGYTPKTAEEEENTLQSSIPLKIAFSIVELDPRDPKEKILTKMLLFKAGELEKNRNVYVAPVFGKGRTTGSVLASTLDTEKILQACKYICGPCSCGVKEQNPGFDLLLFHNWQKSLENSMQIPEKPLADLSSFAADTSSDAKSKVPPVTKELISGELEGMKTKEASRFANLTLLLVAMVLGIVGFSLYIVNKKSD